MWEFTPLSGKFPHTAKYVLLTIKTIGKSFMLPYGNHAVSEGTSTLVNPYKATILWQKDKKNIK